MKKVLFTTFLAISVFASHAQVDFKNTLKWAPMRLLNFNNLGGYLLSYERTFHKHHSYHFDAIKLADPFYEGGSYYSANIKSGFGIGTGYRFYFKIPKLTTFLFGNEIDASLFINPSTLYSWGKREMEWTFIDNEDNNYRDAYTNVQRVAELHFEIGTKLLYKRIVFEFFMGSGKNYYNIKHIGRVNLMDNALILDEYDLIYYDKLGKYAYQNLSGLFRIGFNF